MSLGRPVKDDLKWETTSLEIEQLTYPPNSTQLELEFEGSGLIWQMMCASARPYRVIYYLEDMATGNRLQFVVNGTLIPGQYEYQIVQMLTTGAGGLVANTPYKVTAVVTIDSGVANFSPTAMYEGGAFEA
jgi:hypothetical protein